jgi:hypothetical protein
LDGRWLTCLEGNRQVNPEGSGNVRVDQVAIPEEGLIVPLRGYGLIRVFCEPVSFEQARYWTTNDLSMSLSERAYLAGCAWAIEDYHRGLVQPTERAFAVDAGEFHVLMHFTLTVTNYGGTTVREFSPTGNDLGNYVTGLSNPFGLAFRPDAVPEASSFVTALLGLGLPGAGLLIRRRIRK